MNDPGLDPTIVQAWLSGRSIARGLPAPVPEAGGFRVDTQSDVEVARWVFPSIGQGLKDLARSIEEPRYFLKLCGSARDLANALPTRWQVHAPGFFMQATGKPPTRRLPDGYWVEIEPTGSVLEARIFSDAGTLAARGFAAETRGFVIYDRIATEPEHRRRGLGHSLMLALHEARRHPEATELLVATEDGAALYSALGWKTISPYSTASIEHSHAKAWDAGTARSRADKPLS